MTCNVFIFSHQDDEMAVFNHIENITEKNENILILYLTNGSIKKKIDPKLFYQRDHESIKVLNKLGVDSSKIIFLGRKLETNVYELHKNLQKTYNHISTLLKNVDDKINIYTHANEGGNIDHDSCFYLSKKLINNLSNIHNCYQFSLYNSNKMPFYFYRVMSPLCENGEILKSRLNFFQKLKYSRLLFYYFSQLHIWIGLFPFIIFKIFINKYGSLQLIDKSLSIEKPHLGQVWYEKRKFITFHEFKLIIEQFFQEK